MIAVVPPLWAILLVLLAVGAAALFVVVVGLLWIWGRGEEEALVDVRVPPGMFATAGEAFPFDPAVVRVTPTVDCPSNTVYAFGAAGLDHRQIRRVTARISGLFRPRRRPFDWAHKVGYLNPDGRMITHRGELLGRTEWPRG